MEIAVFNNILNKIVEHLSKASQKVLIAVAWFTNKHIFDEVIRCLKRGIPVKLILIDDAVNKNEYGLDFSEFLREGGTLYFSTRIKVHHKFCVIDNIVITGSYNWTYYAEVFNAENVIISDNSALTKCYENEFERLLTMCERCTMFKPIKLNNINTSELYNNYSYLCNDLFLKGEQYYDIVSSLNKEKNLEIKAEKKEKTEYDYRGIPILKKLHNNRTIVRRLIYLSIEWVPLGRPNAGRKYIHAKSISNFSGETDTWVDIFDTEYVTSVAQYFHKKDGGTLDDNAELPPIPEEIYNPCKKFHFKEVCYHFYGFNKNEGKRKKVGKDGLFIQKDGVPYYFSEFHTLIRCDNPYEYPNKYVEFSSMTELCHLIINSLFVPNVPNDNDMISDYLCFNGVYRASIDDFESICREVERTGFANAELKPELIKRKLQIAPDGVWLLKRDSYILACAYGIYINYSDYIENADNNKNGEWYVLQRLKASYSNHETNKFRELIEGIINQLKKEGRKGIVYKCPIQSIRYFEEIGFRKEVGIGVSGNHCKMRLVFN